MQDWKIFFGNRAPHDGLERLPDAPPWRFAGASSELSRPSDLPLEAEAARAAAFITSDSMVVAVNAALYLWRPLLISGKPGTGKSTLISKIHHRRHADAAVEGYTMFTEV